LLSGGFLAQIHVNNSISIQHGPKSRKLHSGGFLTGAPMEAQFICVFNGKTRVLKLNN
jgi:hypothetical protein